MKNIEEALKRARTPEPVYCGECDEELFSLMDKLCVSLYGKCSMHLEVDSKEETNLLQIIQAI